MVELPRQPTRNGTYKTSWFDIVDRLEEDGYHEPAQVIKAWMRRELVSVAYVNTLLEVSKARQDKWKRENTFWEGKE